MIRSTRRLVQPEFDQHLHQRRFIHCSVFTRMSITARTRMFSLFTNLIRPSEKDRVLDLGVSPEADEPGVNFFERLYPWPHQVTASSISDCSLLEKQFPGLRFVRSGSDPRDPLPFNDQEFDIVFSNAVIEHVGSRERQRAFASEVCRVGRRIFVTTPNRWYPVEFHTRLPLTHWFPQPVYRKLWKFMGLDDWADEENLNLLDRTSLKNVFQGQG